MAHDYNIIIDDALSAQVGERRYIVVTQDNAKVLDNSNGHGYKSIAAAHKGYNYKLKLQDPLYMQYKKTLRKWLSDNLEFKIRVNDFIQSHQNDIQYFNKPILSTANVRKILKNYYGAQFDEDSLPFTVSDLARELRNNDRARAI